MQPRLLKEPLRLAGPALLALQSDERLVRLVRDGHGPAFAAIVDRYRGALLRFCSRLVGEQRAEDAVQQTFVNAHRALSERDTPVQLRPWLYRIAHNAAINSLRGETGDPSLDDPDIAEVLAHTSGRAEGVEATVVRREQLQDTLAAISALPRPQRDALVLRELEGRSHVEIATALGVSAGAARQHLMRARAAVRAAATAVTPYPLLVKVATWMTFTPTGERATQVAVGAGLGAGVAKITAGVLAAGALVGGVVGSGAVPALHHDGASRRTPGTQATTAGTSRPVSAQTAQAPASAGTLNGSGVAPVLTGAHAPAGRTPSRPAVSAATSGREDDGALATGEDRHGSSNSGSGHDESAKVGSGSDGTGHPGSGSGSDSGRDGSGSSGHGSGSSSGGSGGTSGSSDDRPLSGGGASGSGTSSGDDGALGTSSPSSGSGSVASGASGSSDGGGSEDPSGSRSFSGSGSSSGSDSSGGGSDDDDPIHLLVPPVSGGSDDNH